MQLSKHVFVLQINEFSYSGWKNHLVLIETWHLFVNINENFILHEHKNEIYE